MKNPLGSLLGRLLLMTIALTGLVHVTSHLAVNHIRNSLDTQHARRDVLTAVHLKTISGEESAAAAASLGASYVAARDLLPAGCPPPCNEAITPFDRDLLHDLPPGSRVVSNDKDGSVWVRYGDADYWIHLGNLLVPSYRFVGGSVATFILAFLIALPVGWQFQRPLHRLSIAARHFRSGRFTPPVREDGPAEIRQLIADFNGMMLDLSHAERERALLLAGIAHDLKAPITRMQLRISLMGDEVRSAGFARDAQSLSDILALFLEHSKQAAVAPSLEEPAMEKRELVDEHCLQNYGGTLVEEGIVTLDLQAGQSFSLPTVDLDRILSNLFENAMTYGAIPVEISTRREAGSCVLSVRDHGNGVPDGQLESVLQPFARAPHSLPDIDGSHYGLGLAVVKRLTRKNGGEVRCFNASDGGFVVDVQFPC
jgi:two-component system osmolarity sensor histidine kinase EnvZ